MDELDKKMLMEFYRFGRANKKARRFFLFVAKYSSWAFAVLYIVTLIVAALNLDSLTLNLYALSVYLIVPASVLLLSTLLRQTFKRPRPYIACGLKAEYAVKKHWSFPSNHAACAAIIAMGCFQVGFAFGCFAAALALLTGMSRVFTGMHYPGDVMSGYALAGTLAVIGYSLAPIIIK